MNRLEKNAQRHGVLQRWARRTVLAAVIFSPWFFGSAEPWAYLFIALLVNIGVAIWLVSLFWEKRISPLPRGGQTVALLLVGYALVQLTPLPTSLVRAVNPMAAEARLTANDILQQVNLDSYEGKPEPPSSPERSLTLSISPQATRESLFLLLAYLGIFMVLTSTVNEWSKLRSAGYAIIASSFLMAVFAVVQKLSGTRAIYWFHLPRLGGVIFGPFTNRNHFAAHMNMAFGLAVGLIAMSRQWPAISDFHNWRSNLRKYTGMEVGQITLLLFSAVIIGSSICLSLSRGGMASLAASIGVAGFLISMQTRNAESRSFVGILTLLMIAMVVWLGWEPVIRRLGFLARTATDPLHDTRFYSTLATLQIWRASPIVGCGFGSFQHVFPIFQNSRLQFGRFLHAHDDYAEFIAEAGLVGCVLGTVLAIYFLRLLWTARIRAPERSRLFLAGVAVGLLSIAIHSLFDFSLHKPANALLLSALCGLCAAATQLKVASPPASTWTPDGRTHVRIFAAAALVVLLTISLAESRQLGGELAFQRFIQSHQMAEQTMDIVNKEAAIDEATADAEAVMQLSPGDPDALSEVAIQSLWRVSDYDLSPELRLTLASQAARAAWMAVDAAPSDYDGWRWLARTQVILRHPLPARLCMGRAHDLSPPGMELDKLKQRAY